MSDESIIVATSVFNNLYYGGGVPAWDALLRHYSEVIVTDVIEIEMTRFIRMYPKDDDFRKWVEDNELKLTRYSSNVLKDFLA